MAYRMSLILCSLCTAFAAPIKMGQDINYPPYASIDEATGELIGFGADIARGMNAMCDDLELEVVQVKWGDCWTPEGLGAKLEDGSVDACMTYTHTKGLRPQFADFSNGILDVNKAAGLLVLLDESGQPVVTGHDDLSGKKVVDVGGWAPTADGLDFVMNKCTGKNYASDYILLQAVDAPDNNDLALTMLMEGKADAMFVYADQAYNFKKKCVQNSNQAWTCSNWKEFGKKFAYVQTGQFGYVNNGTTLALTKKGSGIVEKLNPCLQKFMATKDYYDICVKYDFIDTCYVNEFFPSAGEIVIHDYNKPTDEHTGDCSDGYCSCPATPAPPPPPPAPASDPTKGGTCCPCLGVLPENIERVACDKPYADSAGQCLKPTVQGKAAMYPTNYGSACMRHIEPGHSDCYSLAGSEKHAEDKMEWCDDPWCYVDPCNCNAPSQYRSDYFAGALTYTYFTCADKTSDTMDRYSKTADGSLAVGGQCDGTVTECVEASTTSMAAIAQSAKGLIATLLCSYCLFFLL